MNTSQKSLEESTTHAIESLQRSTHKYYEDFQDKIRQTPICSVLGAAIIGYLFRFSPITVLTTKLLRLLLILLRPAIFLFGLAKIMEFLKVQQIGFPANETGQQPLQDSPPGPPQS